MTSTQRYLTDRLTSVFEDILPLYLCINKVSLPLIYYVINKKREMKDVLSVVIYR